MSTLTRKTYVLSFSTDLPEREKISFEMNVYPRNEQEAAEYRAALISMREGLRTAGRDATLELETDVSEVVA